MLRTTIIQYRQGHSICMTLLHIVPILEFNYLDFYTLCLYYSHKTSHILCSFLCKCTFWYSYTMLGIWMEGAGHRACTILAVTLVLCQHQLLHTHTGVDLVWWLQELELATTSYTADKLALCVHVSLMNSTQAGWSPALSWSCGTAPIDIHRKWNSRSSVIQTQGTFQHCLPSVVTDLLHQTLPVGRDSWMLSGQTLLDPRCWYCCNCWEHEWLGDTTPNHCPVDQPTGGLVQVSLISSNQASCTAFVVTMFCWSGRWGWQRHLIRWVNQDWLNPVISQHHH